MAESTISAGAIVINGTNVEDLTLTASTSTLSQAALTPGTWVVIAGFSITSNSADTTLKAFLTQGGSNVELTRAYSNAAAGGGISIATILTATATAVVRLRAAQDSGTNKTATNVHLAAVRIA